MTDKLVMIPNTIVAAVVAGERKPYVRRHKRYQPQPITVDVHLSCGHTMTYTSPFPRVGELLHCYRCAGYSVAMLPPHKNPKVRVS
jgi:hypothetical protein